mgnify:CR=1 FL=1
MKKITLSLLIISLFGCASNKKEEYPTLVNSNLVTIWSHPEHGLIDGKNSRLIADRESCQEKAFSSGVEVNGELIKDPKILNKIASDYSKEFYSSQINKFKTKVEKSTRHDLVKEMVKDMVENERKAPSYIPIISSMQDDARRCFREDNQYTLVRTEFYSKKTGALINTIEHNER